MISLYNYQDNVISFMKNIEKDYHSGGMLSLDMGLGKTLTSFGLIFQNKVKTTLIIVPKTLLSNWEQEYHRFQIGREQLTFKKYYNVNISECSFNENIILTTYNTVKTYNKFLQYKFDRIILDESQNIRNPNSKITRQIVQLKGFKKWCLSGTPFYNNYNDLYSQCQFIDIPPYNDKKKWINPSDLFLEEFRKNFCYILKKKDVLVGEQKLPKIHHHKIKLILNETETDIYNKFKRFLNDGGQTLNYLIKIRQSCCNIKVMTKVKKHCCLCTDYVDDREFKCGHSICWYCCKKRRRKTKNCYLCSIESSKFKKIMNIIQNSPPNDKITIFTQWKEMALLLKRFFKSNKIKSHIIHGGVNLSSRDSIIERFKTDNKKILIATIQTCGVGINLTSANHVILLDTWWNSSLEKQAIDRLYRIGQTKEVHVYHVSIQDSIERWINFKQTQKKIQSRILFETDNFEYRKLGRSYGIYPQKKRGRLNISTMSNYTLRSCLDRKILLPSNRVNNWSSEEEFWEEWKLQTTSANIIQNFFRKCFPKKQEVIHELNKYTNVSDISNLIYQYTYYTKKLEL